jgi:hypothetical protein
MPTPDICRRLHAQHRARFNAIHTADQIAQPNEESAARFAEALRESLARMPRAEAELTLECLAMELELGDDADDAARDRPFMTPPPFDPGAA